MADLRTKLLSQPKQVQLLSLIASHYVMKVMAALDYKGIAYTVKDISPLRQKKDIPAPHLVPVLIWGDRVIQDSTRILKFLDEQFPDTTLYPQLTVKTAFASVDEAESWIGRNFYEYCMYFQWLDTYGFKASLQQALKQYIPIPLCLQQACACCLSVEALTKGKRREIRERLIKNLGPQVLQSHETVCTP